MKVDYPGTISARIFGRKILANHRSILVTGGAGFIGSNFVHYCVKHRPRDKIIILDALTYAGNMANLNPLVMGKDYYFIKADINDSSKVKKVLYEYSIDTVVHFAAETHVDRSITTSEAFINTNIVGTYRLLQEVLHYWLDLPKKDKEFFRFLQISTDEVYGALNQNDPPFNEKKPYAPNSPYSASKAAADHIVRAFNKTYGLPTIITSSSNNYGPRQFPEKLIPLIIINAMNGKPLPIYGNGQNIRDWLYVEDHCRALHMVIERGKIGETYNIGGNSEVSNINMVKTICSLLDEMYPESPYIPHASLITFVKDRPGHDFRYAMDFSKIKKEVGWIPMEDIKSGIEKTIKWYIGNKDWLHTVLSNSGYKNWIRSHYNLG